MIAETLVRAGDYLVGVNLTLDGGVVFARAG